VRVAVERLRGSGREPGGQALEGRAQRVDVARRRRPCARGAIQEARHVLKQRREKRQVEVAGPQGRVQVGEHRPEPGGVGQRVAGVGHERPERDRYAAVLVNDGGRLGRGRDNRRARRRQGRGDRDLPGEPVRGVAHVAAARRRLRDDRGRREVDDEVRAVGQHPGRAGRQAVRRRDRARRGERLRGDVAGGRSRRVHADILARAGPARRAGVAASDW